MDFKMAADSTYTTEQIDKLIQKITDKTGWENRGRVNLPIIKDKDKPLKG